MKQSFLKKFIDQCPITNFSEEGNVKEREIQFKDYINSLTSYIYTKDTEFACSFWNEIFAQNQFSNINSYPLLKRVFIFFDVAVAIYNKITFNYINKKKVSKSAEMLSIQIKNTFKLFTSIITLIMNNCVHSVITEYRTMYESFVITRYLLLHPDLIPVYYDHAKLINCLINKSSNFCPKKQIEEYDSLIKKYGEDFKHEFGWTKKAITNPKNRKLITLANECKLDDFFYPLYKTSCQYSHPSSMASITNTPLEFAEPFIQVTLYIILYEIVDLINECKVVKKEACIMHNLLEQLFEDIHKEFYEPKLNKYRKNS